MSAYRRRGFASGSSRVRYLGSSRGGGRGRGSRFGQDERQGGNRQYDEPTMSQMQIPESSHESFDDSKQSRTRSSSSSPNRQDAGPSDSSCSRGRGSGRPPAHLRGREIGMWYRDQQKQKGPKPVRKPGLFAHKMKVTLDEDRQEIIAKLLEQLGDTPDSLPLAVNAEPSASTSTSSLFSPRSDCFPTPIESYRDSSLDDILKQEFRNKSSSQRYQNMITTRRALPAFGSMTEIIDQVIQNQVIVISGETGCGKTTQVPQFILDRWIEDGNGSTCNIVCTQPRRISAISVAERVAEERDDRVGGKSIGYSIRLDSRLPQRRGGTITFCTTGVILQLLKSDPFLNQVSHIILDEIHERDVLCDFLLAIVKDLIVLRPDLKVILMSATLNAPHFQNYFDNCPLYHIPGVIYPVTTYYLEDVVEMTNFMFPQKNEGRFYNGGRPNSKFMKAAAVEQQQYEIALGSYIRSMERKKEYSWNTINQIRHPESEELNLDLIEQVIIHICETDETNGSILVFLPGWDNISKLDTQLSMNGKFNPSTFMIIPLHSMMPTINQREVFNPPPPGKRKIIISTNIAETSITIDDIIFVIDCGRIKMSNFDIELNVETLNAEWVSLANAKQRKGRAGRVKPGVCYHLFSKGREALMSEFVKPEVLRKRLEEVVLQIKMLQLGKAADFFNKLLDPPDPRAVELALKRLRQLNALDGEENLTPLGFHLAQLPMDPQTGRMILMGAIFSCCSPILSVAASLSFKDAFVMPLGHERNVDMVRQDISAGSKSDHLVLARAIAGYEEAKIQNRQREYCSRNYLSTGTLNMLINLKTQFAQNLFDLKFLPSADWKNRTVNSNSGNEALVRAIICAGLYPNVGLVKVRKFPFVYTPEDGRVGIHPKSVNAYERYFESPFVVYHQKKKSKSILLHDTTMVSPLALIFFGGELSFMIEDGSDMINVDNRIRFLCRKNIYDLVEKLRGHLDRLLELKIRNPGPTLWAEATREGNLLRAIAQLITAENREIMNIDSGSDSQEFDY